MILGQGALFYLMNSALNQLLFLRLELVCERRFGRLGVEKYGDERGVRTEAEEWESAS